MRDAEPVHGTGGDLAMREYEDWIIVTGIYPPYVLKAVTHSYAARMAGKAARELDRSVDLVKMGSTHWRTLIFQDAQGRVMESYGNQFHEVDMLGVTGHEVE